jgi:hypothetical protein
MYVSLCDDPKLANKKSKLNQTTIKTKPCQARLFLCWFLLSLKPDF